MKQIKKIQYYLLISSALLIINSKSFGQYHKCGTMDNYQIQKKHNNAYFQSVQEAESTARKWQLINGNKTSTQNILYVPVIFHCIYKSQSDATYLADSIFNRQIDVMNETYSLSNPNFTSTRSIFDTIAADTEIRFCLAGQDTLGNPISGILRYQSNQNWLSSITTDAIKTAYPPWNPAKYLNVWTCDMSLLGIPIVLGYSSFPGGPPAKDGIVLQSQFVGYQNNGTENNLGRTMVHEAGHWLGLRHIWGDGQQSSSPCDSTDYVEDTPHASDASQTDCDTTKNTCSAEDSYWTQLGIDPPDMVENYMDYSKDGCMTMFTKGQKARMWSFINTYRSGLLLNPVSCNMVGMSSTDINQINAVLFPNPADKTLSIKLLNTFEEPFSVEFTDFTGKRVAVIHEMLKQQNINVSEFEKGVYFVRLIFKNNFIIKKFIKE